MDVFGPADLAVEIVDTFLSAKFRKRDLMRMSELAASQRGKNIFYDWLRDFFGPFEPTEAHEKLPLFRWRMIVTTNYDRLIERAYDQAANGAQSLVKRVKDAEPFDLRLQQHAAPLEFLKLHGCIGIFRPLSSIAFSDAPDPKKRMARCSRTASTKVCGKSGTRRLAI